MKETNLISNEYDRQALEFLEMTNTKMDITFSGVCKNYLWDNRLCRKYHVIIKRNNKQWMFYFYCSINNTKRPTPYDVLACITKYEPEDNIEDFAKEYGYNYEPYEDRQGARRIERIYNAVIKEYENCYRLFGDVMDELREIY